MEMEELMQQAKLIQDQMQKTQEKLLSSEVRGESGAGSVVVIMNGRHDVKSIKIDPSLVRQEVNVLQDLIAAAVNDAVQKVEELNKDSITNLTKGINLPDDLKMPF